MKRIFTLVAIFSAVFFGSSVLAADFTTKDRVSVLYVSYDSYVEKELGISGPFLKIVRSGVHYPHNIFSNYTEDAMQQAEDVRNSVLKFLKSEFPGNEFAVKNVLHVSKRGKASAYFFIAIPPMTEDGFTALEKFVKKEDERWNFFWLLRLI